ncbi:4-alpha-glucanotransferase [Gammaproteobacteria bacterium]|nr:4-alpha-glucanotransferase [Gammaproteobacteria bacterium]
MALTDLENFDRLCALSGIVDSYYDIRGVHHVASVDARRTLLGALRVAANSDEEVNASLEAIWRRDWQPTVAAVLVYRESDEPHDIILTLDQDQISQPLHWQVDTESGETYHGSWEFNVDLAIDDSELDGKHRLRFRVPLQADTGLGYHRLYLQLAGRKVESLLIVAPQTCYLPDAIEAGDKTWGVSLQLYSLRSRRNWGIGDFSDLQAAVETLAPLGIDCIGLNPLHALFSHLPENASPYSPSSRDFINPLYLDIEAIEEFHGSDAARQLVHSDHFQARLQALREPQLVDYSGVWCAKLEVLELIYRQFRRELADSASPRAQSFRKFQACGGDALFKFALFEALQVFFHDQDAAIETWQQWPEAFHDPESTPVAEWAATQQDTIEFYQFLQWQAELQLSSAQQDCARRGMQIGIYNDLAVGNERFSSQCWAEQEQYALGTGIGAPPDDFSPAGQSWGLPPLIPQRLREQAYHPFICSLRANMRNAGALRIDHVMGLMRLYWVPANYAADQGTYVTYPFDDLLGILALESQRNRCLVIGEDLGTVPDEVRHALWVNKILSYRILLFEKDWQVGSFKPPSDYPPLALCASGSHDLPTLLGYWQEADLAIREALKLYPCAESAQQQRHLRQRDREEILIALARENLLEENSEDRAQPEGELNSERMIAIQRFLARSQACLMMVQLEDLLGQTQQINLPGTIDEYPNWRHKIPLDISDWCAPGGIEPIAAAINHERSS